MKTINELEDEKQLYIEAISILDTITEEETGKDRTDEEFQYYESWATSDMKKELTSKIGEIEVQILNNEDNTGNTEREEEE